ncbi:EAL domain-containing protein [Marichromatium gracile]|uniref:Diguanylate cyclase (GGDEF)-like protein n=1 Tax=Marichromatium gracile TaxID=1048 RepID=A0ABR5VG62_MARGR|nr:EAL domain-containing protein [Marichromatium gracile]KXX64738.1 hypothetical protein AY586_12440 [Marichromatium gracile]
MSRIHLSRLQFKLWLGVGIVVLIGFLALQFDHHRTLRQLMLDQVRDDARTLHTVLLAAHRVHYLTHSGDPSDQAGFLPAPAIDRLAEAVQEQVPNALRFSTVSLRARNPAHQADADEIEAIRFFERTPEAADRLVALTDADGQRFYHYARPIWVEPACLGCHGDRAAAPPAIAEHYQGGFGYRAGELRGILSVRIPGASVERRTDAAWFSSMLDHLLIFPLMLLTGGVLLQRFVVDKVTRLERAAHALAVEREVAPLPCDGHDELDELARAFNRMSVQTLARARALREERAFLQHVIDGIDEPILVIGLDYQVLRMNQCARELMRTIGLAPNAFRCHQLWQGRDEPCGDARNPCPLQRILDTRAPCKVVHHRTDKDGRERSFEVAASPLYDDDGHIVGIIEASREITERLHLLARLEASDQANTQLTRYDLLTGLPNRALFSERLTFAIEQARVQGDELAVLIVDLDRFKHINDSFDHSDGDRILKRVANRLRGLFAPGDTLARMGGDEFGVILRGLRGSDQVIGVAQRIIGAFSTPFELQGHNLVLGASIGISRYPEHGASGDDLIRNADAALYRAKAGGGGTFDFYTEELTAHAFEQVLLEGSLRQALAEESFVLHYQPQLELNGERLHGLEALVRWQHPELGLVAPGKFIPLAEESGLIVPLGRWVLAEACRQMAEWRDAGLLSAETMMCVNLSTKQFADHELLGVIQRSLRESGLAAGQLELEVTESVMMRASDQVIPQLERLRALGIKVALDDFGTGYSSLSYLKRLPFTKLKIDRSFVSELPEDASDVAITKAIIALAESLSLDVLAEGVETARQRDFLRVHGCRLAQGFLYSRPLSATECKRYLAALSARPATG